MKYNLDRVPSTLEEAVDMLFAALEPADISYLKQHGSDGTHFGAGLWTRNNWSLWDPECPLHIHFRDTLGLGHADDMSGILMESLARRVRGEPLDIEGQVKDYKAFWSLRGVDPKTLQQVGPDRSQTGFVFYPERKLEG